MQYAVDQKMQWAMSKVDREKCSDFTRKNWLLPCSKNFNFLHGRGHLATWQPPCTFQLVHVNHFIFLAGLRPPSCTLLLVDVDQAAGGWSSTLMDAVDVYFYCIFHHALSGFVIIWFHINLKNKTGQRPVSR